MSDAKKVKNTKEKSEKKYFLIFMLIMVLSLIGGFFVGFMMKRMESYIDITENELVSLKVALAYLIPAITVAANVVTFVIALVLEFIILKLVIDLEKKLNPEKRGSIFEVNFAKKWEDSCDEAQKLVSYKAGYAAYKAGNTACICLWLLAFIGQMMFHTGVFPVICIGIIWLVMLITYSGFCMKAEKYEK